MTHSRSVVAAACAFHVLSLLACGSDRPVAMIAPTAVITPSLEQRLTTTADAGFTITSLVGGTSCPTLEFRISTYLIKTTAATAYAGGSCANLQAGTKLAALNGARPNMNDFVVYATHITIQPTAAPPPTAPAPPVATPPVVTPTPTPTPPVTPVPPPFETTVTVSSLVSTSACPYREFMVGGYRLTTSALTRYDGGHCADIAAGRTLAIVATRGKQDTAVLVAAVTFTQRPAEASTVDTVSAWVTIDSVTAGATCPAISFLVGPYRVTVDATTVYEGGMCTDLKPGATLRLEGTRLADDRVQAVRLSFTD